MYIALSLSLLIVDYRYHAGKRIREVLSVLLIPVEYVVSTPIAGYQWLQSNIVSYSTLLNDNLELKQELSSLQFKLLRMSALEAQNQQLQALLQSSNELSDDVQGAQLLSVGSSPYQHQLVINRGRLHGVYDGQPVLDAHGVMGQILHVGASTSKVLLITDISHAIPVQNNRNGVRAIAVGTGDLGYLELIYVPSTTDIKEGDLLVSSGLGQKFPVGYPVARVDQIKIAAGEPFVYIRAIPLAQLKRSRQVLLVNKQNSIDSLYQEIQP